MLPLIKEEPEFIQEIKEEEKIEENLDNNFLDNKESLFETAYNDVIINPNSPNVFSDDISQSIDFINPSNYNERYLNNEGIMEKIIENETFNNIEEKDNSLNPINILNKKSSKIIEDDSGMDVDEINLLNNENDENTKSKFGSSNKIIIPFDLATLGNNTLINSEKSKDTEVNLSKGYNLNNQHNTDHISNDNVPVSKLTNKSNLNNHNNEKLPIKTNTSLSKHASKVIDDEDEEEEKSQDEKLNKPINNKQIDKSIIVRKSIISKRDITNKTLKVKNKEIIHSIKKVTNEFPNKNEVCNNDNENNNVLVKKSILEHLVSDKDENNNSEISK